jgi:hypothetical protein
MVTARLNLIISYISFIFNGELITTLKSNHEMALSNLIPHRLYGLRPNKKYLWLGFPYLPYFTGAKIAYSTQFY